MTTYVEMISIVLTNTIMRIKGSSIRPTENKRQDKEYKSYSECYHNTFTCPISASTTDDRDLNQSSIRQQKQLTHKIIIIFPHKCTPITHAYSL